MRHFCNQRGETEIDLTTFLHQNDDIHSVRVILLFSLQKKSTNVKLF